MRPVDGGHGIANPWGFYQSSVEEVADQLRVAGAAAAPCHFEGAEEALFVCVCLL